MSNAVVLFALLILTWMVLSGFFSPFFLGLGIFSCALAVFIAYQMRLQLGAIRDVVPMLWRFPKYLAWLEWEIIKSSLQVSVKIWQITPDISPTVAWVPTKQKDDLGVTIFANSITLTPGTVSVMVEPKRIQVHALNKEGIDDLKEGTMDRHVADAACYE